MIAQLQDLELERLIQGMQAEIFRRLNAQGSSPRSVQASRAKGATASKSKNGNKGSHFSGIKKGGDECYVRGKLGHYARDCWYKASGYGNGCRGFLFHGYREGGCGFHRGVCGRGRGRVRSRGCRRGLGGRSCRGRGRGGYSSNHCFSQGFNNGNGAHPAWRNESNSTGQHAMPFDQQHPHSQHPQANFQQLGNQENHQVRDQNYPFQGFMANIKRSNLASINTTKTDDVLIDSSATHFFFHSIKYFQNYRRIEEKDVQSASGVSRIVGMDTIFIPI